MSDTETDGETAESTDDLDPVDLDDPTDPEERADAYERWFVPTGIKYPISALKLHVVQFGATLGVLFALLANAEVAFVFGDIEADAYGIAVLAMVAIALWALGFTKLGPFEDTVEEDEDAVGVEQIQRKPHYLVVTMTIAFVVTHAVLSFV